MELPKRAAGDEYTKVGEYPELRRRLRTASKGIDVPTAAVYAFDERTKLLPHLFYIQRMSPAGVRSLGAALFDSGLTNVRVVLQQWTPNFRPSRARLNGKSLEMLLVSSMQIHAERAYELISDACRNSGPSRPLIIAGGPKVIYEPWDMFGIGGDPNVGADIACTGEEFILMQLIEVLLTYRGKSGTMLEAFRAARRDGAIAGIPGLMYREDDAPDARLLSTGVQRLVRDLDEMPHPVIGYSLLEPPHRTEELSLTPLEASQVRRRTPVGSLTLSHGCKFNCDYCPIPAYNQRTYRHKSGERVADEMKQLNERFGIRLFFGTDDNFFNNRGPVEEMFTAMASTTIAGKPLGDVVHWGTEATEFDTWKNRDLLPLAQRAGLRAIWFGIEDITATLVKKGQSVNKTAELFDLLRDHSILPMPMMMHHDGQPLYTRGRMYGLLNQVNYLRKCGAQSMQVTVLTPAVGTRAYEANYDKRLVFDAVGGAPVLQYQFDGNHVVASNSKRPWALQLNVLLAYMSFYNPLNLARNLLNPFRRSLTAMGVFRQMLGMTGLIPTAVHSVSWAWRLRRGPIQRAEKPPGPKAPVVELEQGIDSASKRTVTMSHQFSPA